jgi:hypothetical protein
MANKTLRKSLAGLSVAVLGVTAFVAAAPAYAAGELKLEVASGTVYAVPHTDDIELKTSVTSGNDSDELVYLKYKIETAGSVTVHAVTADAAGITNSVNTDIVAASATSAVLTDGNFVAGDLVNFINLRVEDSASAAYAVTADTVRITVTAFIDKDNDGVVDTGEWSAVQTVDFVDSDVVAMTTVLTQPALTSTALTATVTSSNVNVAESEDILEVYFTDSNGPVNETDTSGVYDSVDNDLTFSVTSTVPAGNTAAAGTYSAVAQFLSTAIDLSNTSSRTVSAADVSGLVLTDPAGNDTEAESGNDIDARSGAGSVTLTYTVTASKLDGEVVTLVVSENAVNSLASGASVNVSGTTFSNTNAATTQKATVTGTTDVDGEVTFVVAWTGAVKTNVLSFSASVDGQVVADTLTFEDAAAESVFNTDVTGTSSSEIYVAKDAAFSLNYSLVDQFGALFTAANHTVQVSDSAVTATGVFSGGKTTVNFGGYAALGAKTMTATAYKSAVSTSKTTTTEVTVGSPKAVSAVTVVAGSGDSFGTAAAKEALMLKTWTAADVRNGQTAPVVANGNTVEATLTDVNGNATQGAVTFSGTGLLFGSQSQLFSTGSITVQTNASGLATVEVYSNTSGTLPLTVTAGGVTAAAKSFYFAAAGATTAASITITAPATASQGTTIQFTGVVADKYGNGVAATSTQLFSVSYTGPGFAQAGPTTANADGSFSLNVLVGTNDSGTGTVTVKYSTANDANYTSATDLVVSKSVLVGSFKGYVALYAKGYAGKKMSAIVAGKWIVVASLASDFERVVRYTGAGYDIVTTIYIDGVMISTFNVTTK